ncbi:hypothetical protein COW09_01625 [bacterium (Candidatus Moisslbacteria) CG12_big_fil_rev_8_21_14_0_65_36_11]|nr:hypothetical protein [Candidatus Kuenenbacteria bacterium]OIP77147.1 MAG: hypothetical protein AUK09_00465 [Parcubacteria group bacterium CG2_30_36_38]PIW67773.1 MAG: hypothetical protein COW09_01625 [bacterium (Candidatus Moisslbacteria) CG12_big_fil_rev_8_21_14_0_65_36_11]PIZ90359.1 MAG: hypothetical protein COX87_00930 [bacterium (Candidatus Moisslbacteria) CG_4_10_14_0_2_um_filter_36_61]PJC00584.1 MAG: hypothetical protein CO074_01775 [bacterium (Candidatus Moisslbacteria) CG_4_9_14_0_8_
MAQSIQQATLFLNQNAWALYLVVVWTIIWKGLVLWKSARSKDLWWFIALLVINTLGILEILYFFIFSKRKSLQIKI